VHEAVPVDLREGAGYGDGEAQKAAHFHGRAEQPLGRLAPGSSSRRTVCPRSRTSDSGRTARAPSSSSFNPYS
jgi:hypothetical protein